MHGQKTWQILKLGMISSIVVCSLGCSDSRQSVPPKKALIQTSPIVSQSAVVNTPVDDTGYQQLSFEECGSLPNWERPNLETQEAELTNNPRYAEGLDEEPLKSLSEKFWSESIITFTTYGLSARVEPIYLSGIWTAIDAMQTCYEGDRPDDINQGRSAEIWLIGYRAVSVEWVENQYHVTVEPTPRGLRFIQFERLEASESLPIVVMDTDGTEIEITTGDW